MTSRRSTSPRCRFAAPAILAVLLALTGCYGDRAIPSMLPSVGASAVLSIGPTGGTVQIEDLTITIPPGAVPAASTVTVSIEEPARIGRLRAFSPIVRFEPEGLELLAPAEIRIPFRGDAALANAFISSLGGASFAPRPTLVEGDVAVLATRSLRSTFVGSACEGEGCVCEPTGALDLLVVMDNSNSMNEEQGLLREELPGLFRALATGDLDGDGTQDLASFESVRVGVVTTDLGAGPALVPTCGEGLGDDGVLLSAPGSGGPAACPSEGYRSPIAVYDGSNPEGLDGFVQQIACTSAAGVGGCGFERQLESALLALSPNEPQSYTAPGYAPPLFSEMRRPQGDRMNAGFLRDGSVLAVLFVTDEDDCSVVDPGLFDPTSAVYSEVGLNLRCHEYESTALFDVPTLVEGLTGLRPQPQDLVVAAITGVPTSIAVDDLDAVLANPAMVPTPDPSMSPPTNLSSVCSSSRGVAFPANRIVRALRGVQEAGGRAVVQSICDDSFSGISRSLATALAERAGGDC